MHLICKLIVVQFTWLATKIHFINIFSLEVNDGITKVTAVESAEKLLETDIELSVDASDEDEPAQLEDE